MMVDIDWHLLCKSTYLVLNALIFSSTIRAWDIIYAKLCFGFVSLQPGILQRSSGSFGSSTLKPIGL